MSVSKGAQWLTWVPQQQRHGDQPIRLSLCACGQRKRQQQQLQLECRA